MKTLKMLVAVFAAAFASHFAFAVSGTQTIGDYTWTYSDAESDFGGVQITAVSPKPTGAVTIPSKLGGANVTVLMSNLFMDCEELTSVSFPSSLKLIAFRAFSGCTALRQVKLPAGLSRLGRFAFSNSGVEEVELPSTLDEIQDAAFNECHSLSSVTLHEGLVKIGGSVFSGCHNLASCTLPSTVREIGTYAFLESGLESVDIPVGVEVLEQNTFEGCRRLVSVSIPNTVTNIGQSVFARTALTSVELPAGLRFLGDNAFQESQLAAVTIPVGVTELNGGTFRSCTNLTSVTLPAGLTSLGNEEFNGCTSLSEVVWPTALAAIGRRCFMQCKSLDEIEFPSSLRTVDYSAFWGCDGLTSVYFNDGATDIGQGAFSQCSKLKSVRLPATLRRLGVQAFYLCSALEGIELPATLEDIGQEAFASCSALSGPIVIGPAVTNLGLKAFQYTAVTNIEISSAGLAVISGNAFSYCEQVESVTIADGVATIDYSAFYGCRSLREISLPSSLKTIGETAFSRCESLLSVSIPSEVTEIGPSAFEKCTALKSCNVPSGVAEIKYRTFHGCFALASVTLSEGILRIGPHAFSSCNVLPSITIPSSVTSLGDGCFSSCGELTEVVLPDGITEIPQYAFNECLKLSSVKLPLGLRTLGKSAFYGTIIADIDIPASVESIGDSALYSKKPNFRVRFFGEQPESVGKLAFGSDSSEAYVPGTESWAQPLADGVWHNLVVHPLSEHPDVYTHLVFVDCEGGCALSSVQGTPPDGSWIVVPAEHEGKKVVAIYNSVFAGCSGVERIVLPDTIEKIYSGAFSGCSGLESLEFPASLRDIASDALDGCSNLKTVVFNGYPLALGSEFYEDTPEDLVTYVSWKTAYDTWVGSVSSGEWQGRAIKWSAPLDGAWDRGVAVYRSDLETLVFYGDGQDHTSEGPVYLVSNAEAVDPGSDYAVPWRAILAAARNARRVVFDASFANCRPKHCAKWFINQTALESVEGLEYLDLSEATSIRQMFAGCTALKTLDLMAFATSGVTDMAGMFSGCSALETIYASSAFDTSALDDPSQALFDGCTALKGGTDFEYDAQMVSAEYAKVDTVSVDGYFSGPRRAVVVQDRPAGSLDFYYDSVDRSTYGGPSVYDLEECDSENPPWAENPSWRPKDVRLDPSFADYRPTSCARWFANASCDTIDGLRYLDVSHAESLAGMFSNCTWLVELDLLDFETAGVTNLAHMFSGCETLKTIYVSSLFQTGALVDGGEPVFDGCESLVGGKGFAYDATKVSSEYARIDSSGSPGYFTEPRPMPVAVFSSALGRLTFYYDMEDHAAEGSVYSLALCTADSNPPWYSDRSSITEVRFDESFAAYRPTACYRWFNLCVNLTTVLGIENLDVSDATTMKQMFASCESLTTLDLSRFDTRKVTTMGNMFYHCSALTTIYVSSDFVTEALDNQSENVFDTCTHLVGGAGTQFEQSKRNATYARIDTVDTPGYFTELGAEPVALLSNDGKQLTFYYGTQDLSGMGTVYSVTEAEARDPATQTPPWAGAASTVTTVRFDRSFANYKPTHCGRWFSEFTKLTKVQDLGNLDLSNATSLRLMFYRCSALTALDLSGHEVTGVTDFFGMFRGCSSLTSLDLSKLDTSSATVMTMMFGECQSLTSLDLSSFDTAKVTSMMNMFADCIALETVLVSGGFTNAAVTDKSEYVFYGCIKLKGGAGTACDGMEDVSAAFAVVDGGETAPGYLTKKRIAQAVLSSDRKTLTFVYDTADYPTAAERWFVADAEAQKPSEDAPWRSCGLTVTGVVFDVSFADYRPVHCGSWFAFFYETRAFVGLENLNVTAAHSLTKMFYVCYELTELDLSSWKTINLTDMSYMFRAKQLKTIYASSGFSTLRLADPDQVVFYECPSLVGGRGTEWDSSRKSARLARIDASGAIGLFTDKNASDDVSGYAAWVAEMGLTGANAACDAKPDLWGGKWENAFIYTYGEGLADGTLAIMNISFDSDGKPVITTAPVIEGRDDFTPAVIGTPNLQNWTSPVVLENKSGDEWTLPAGKSANFFRVRLSK